MKRVLIWIPVTALLIMGLGCEWEYGDGDVGTWNDSVSWVNFSGTYRSGTSTRALISNFSLDSGGSGVEDEDDDGDGTSYTEDPPSNAVSGTTVSAPFTTFTGTIPAKPNASGYTLKPGSVTINIIGQTTGPTGTFDDDGGGNLSGSFSQIPGGSSYSGTGTIDYDTRSWSIALDRPFVETADVLYDFVYRKEETSTNTTTTTTATTTTAPTLGGQIYSMQVVQTGDHLIFTDSNGYTYEGQLFGVSTAAGNTTGDAEGTVSASFEVNSEISGRDVSIVGTFSGGYTLEEGEDESVEPTGQLENRTIEGTYIQPAGSGDLFGVARDVDVSND